MQNKILEAIQKGIQKSFNFEVNLEDDDFKINKSKLKRNSVNNWVYEQYQEKYKKMIDKKDFKGCCDLYNSKELTHKARSIRYKVNSNEELKNLVSNFDNKKWHNFDLNWIDVSMVTDMSKLFFSLKNFNCDISEWDVSNVTNMCALFKDCRNFNQNINKWDVSNVTDMSEMFRGCKNFNQPLNDWNVSNVNLMEYMFYKCVHFNQPLDKWDVSNVSNMYMMFEQCIEFNQDISNWDISKTYNVILGYVLFVVCGLTDKTRPKYGLKGCYARTEDISSFS